MKQSPSFDKPLRKGKKRRIRPLALCVIRRPADRRLLLMKGYDSVKEETFYRPLGGGIEFGETGEEAIKREIMEELGASLFDILHLGYFENIFTCEGDPGHEIITLFEATLVDLSLYRQEAFHFFDGKDNQEEVTAVWRSLSELKQEPLYPDGLRELLATGTTTSH